MLGLVCFFMMLMFYLECGFSLLPHRKSFARGTPFLLRDVKRCQYFFINDLVHLNPTLTQVERVLPKRSSQRVCCLILTAHPVARFFIEHGQRAIVCGLRVYPAELRAQIFPRFKQPRSGLSRLIPDTQISQKLQLQAFDRLE